MEWCEIDRKTIKIVTYKVDSIVGNLKNGK